MQTRHNKKYYNMGWQRVGWNKFTDVSEERTASIYTVEDECSTFIWNIIEFLTQKYINNNFENLSIILKCQKWFLNSKDRYDSL
jgi:hypothetical protein